MNATVWVGAAGAGKTQAAIEYILSPPSDFAETWVLLPTRLQSEAFRERIIHHSSTPIVFNVRFFEFYELYNYLLDLAGLPQRVIYPAASDRILRHVVTAAHAEQALSYYQQIADKPGFIQLVSGFIKELKQGVVPHESFMAAAQTDKDHDLALIYQRYQEFLIRHHLSDRDGAGWVALEALKGNEHLVDAIGRLVIDGFDDFNPLQVALLNALAQQVQETVLTLTYEAHRSDTACRIFAWTLENLQADADHWQITPISPHEQRVPDLIHLENQLFTLDAPAKPTINGLQLIEAPNPQEEARAVLRHVKRLILAGVSPESILVTMRDAKRYAEPLRSAAEAYHLPLVVRQSEYVLENPAVLSVLQVLDLHHADFPRRAVLDMFYSPYLDIPYLSQADRDELEHLSMERPIVKGRDQWIRGVQTQRRRRDEFGELPSDAGVSDPIEMSQNLNTFFERITPPKEATPGDYIAWIEALLGTDPTAADPTDESTPARQPDSLNVYVNVRHNTSTVITVRDMHALHGFRRALQEVLAAYNLLETTVGEIATIAWVTFRADLELALRNRLVESAAQRSRYGRVLATTVFEARGLPHDYVFILGLAESVFPQSQQDDPLYTDTERHDLRSRKIPLPLAGDRLRDRELFYEMCSLAQIRLTLSRPTIDDGGNEWAASAFWHAATNLLTDAPLDYLRAGAPPTPETAASLREATVSLSRQLNDAPSQQSWAQVRWLMQQPHWESIIRGRQIELNRESAGVPFDHYSGIIDDPALLTALQPRLNDRLWSATQFNELGTCNFRFFSHRMLKLDPYEEPEEGLDILQLGTINHKILEDTYNQIAHEGLAIHPDNQARALEILDRNAKHVLKSAPRDFQFQAPPFWAQQQQNLIEKLRRVVALDFESENPIGKFTKYQDRITHQQEALFGRDGQAPLMLTLNGQAVQVQGAIDRMDKVAEQVVIIDYKSGSSTPSKKDLTDGANYQMLLYILAAQQMGYDVYGGAFWSLQNNKVQGTVTVDDDALNMAHHHLEVAHAEIQNGNFANQPRKLDKGKCYKYCHFHQFCRVNRASTRKPTP